MKDQNMKIGILGGSFNPVHNGHLELAKQALEQFALDQIWLMPNHIPAYKKWDRSVTNEDRLHMVELAVKDHDGLRCSDLELQRGGVTYTVDTLAQLHEQYPDTEWYFIMGGDSILAFDSWREPDRILSLSKLIVTTRDQIQAEDIEIWPLPWRVAKVSAQFPFARVLGLKIAENICRCGYQTDADPSG